MTKQDAAGILALIFGISGWFAWFLLLLYAKPGSKLEKITHIWMMIIGGIAALGVIGFIGYCILIS